MQQFKRDLTQNSDKLHLDKYYTSEEVAQYCIDKTRQILKNEKISEVIEPSAGSGVFSKKIKNCIAYDIEPTDDSVIQQNFLLLNIPYKQGRLFIGNPPFGTRNTLSVKFFKKCIQLGDYIAFILPISQFNNNQQMYEFDLVYSEDLGLTKYTDRNLHCCFNIYKRPESGLNKKKKYNFKDFKVLEYRRGGSYKKPKEYDIGFCAWGASLGKQIIEPGQYALELYVKIFNKEYKQRILDILTEEKIKNIKNHISTPKIEAWRIYEYISKNIKELI
jgi:hypothetical protein